MTTPNQDRIYTLLQRLPTEGLEALKRLVWTELNYDRVAAPLSIRDWPEGAREVIAAPPILLAQYEASGGSFDVIYAQLPPAQVGRSFPLSLTAERAIVTQLLPHHPTALFIFSDQAEQHWHFVSVKYQRAEGQRSGVNRVLRRIAVGPREHLHTAAERIAMLDLSTLSPDLADKKHPAGLSALAIQQRHDEAFDVEAVTRAFFTTYRARFEAAEALITGLTDAEEVRLFTQRLFNRLLFIAFLERKGWLTFDGRSDYLQALWDAYQSSCHSERNEAQHSAAEGPALSIAEGPTPSCDQPRCHSERNEAQRSAAEESALSIAEGPTPSCDQPRCHSERNGAQRSAAEESALSAVEGPTPSCDQPRCHSERNGAQRSAAEESALSAVEGANFYRDRLAVLFFAGLNNPGSVDYLTPYPQGFIQQHIGDVPYLNGGLFEREALDEREGVTVPDAVFAPLFDTLLHHYNFTVTESTPLDVEVAVDPEMLGKIFEELVTGRHESGSYYTPKPIVAFMCREALRGHLRDRCPREAEDAIAAFVDARDARDLRAPEAVLTALREVRACDPACGSGAYLLGMLHELVELRQALFVSRRLDPRSAYARKLEIIQNNLYGVDLDPFAVNIARLRLWLSLIVDFESDAQHPQPPPLPNLDFKIEVGDSLTAPAPQQLQPDLFHHQLVQEYFARKGQFMTAHGPEKHALWDQIAEVQREIAEWAGTGGDPDAFDWTVEFAEVFTAPDTPTPTLPRISGEGDAPGAGFDIVVANPPYVRQELIRPLKPTLKGRYPEVYSGYADLYVYFYARALHLLREGGMGVFISSNKWLRAGYGKKLRGQLKKNTTVTAIVDFGDLPVFGAIAYPQIIAFRKASPPENHAIRALEVDDLAVVDRLGEVVQEQAWEQPQGSLREAGWVLVKPKVLTLLRKLRKAGMTLGTYVEGQFYRGIVTGYNKAFVIDQTIRDRLIADHPSSAKVIKPMLRGRDVKRWRVDFQDVWLIFTYRGIQIDKYPAVKNHLLQFKRRLMKRAGNQAWYELQAPPGDTERFENPKIIYPHFNTEPNFAFDQTGALGNDKTYTIPEAGLYLLGLLNSSVVNFFLHQICPAVQRGYMELRTIYIEQIPIPDPTPDQRAAIEALVRKLLDAEGQGPHVEAWERALNDLVYQVYGLTEGEIALVEAAS
jgi:hypothetical protein